MCGLREVLKHLKLKRLKCLVIAPNLDRVQSEGRSSIHLHTHILHMCVLHTALMCIIHYIRAYCTLHMCILYRKYYTLHVRIMYSTQVYYTLHTGC